MTSSARSGSAVPSYSLIDGLQVRLTDKFRPPKRVTLPSEYVNRLQQDIEAILDLDYDFKLEEEVLATYPRGGPDPELHDEPVENSEHNTTSNPPSKTGTLTKPARPPPPHSSHGATTTASDPSVNANKAKGGVSMNPAFASVSYRPMEPQKASNVPKAASTLVQGTKNDFRVEDFEPNTANPFDNLELKSLNDMEELQRVLGKDS